MSSTPSKTDAATSGRRALAVRPIVTAVTVFALFFLMGFISAWLKSEGDLTALLMRGLKVGVAVSVGILCIVSVAKTWQRLRVPAWIPPMASMAVGFLVMSGLGEIFDGNYSNVFPKAGGGFLLGACIGLGIYRAKKQGWMRNSFFGVATQKAEPNSSDDVSG